MGQNKTFCDPRRTECCVGMRYSALCINYLQQITIFSIFISVFVIASYYSCRLKIKFSAEFTGGGFSPTLVNSADTVAVTPR